MTDPKLQRKGNEAVLEEKHVGLLEQSWRERIRSRKGGRERRMGVGKGLRMRKQWRLTRGSGLYCAAASLKENMGVGVSARGRGLQPAASPHPPSLNS